MIDPEATVHLGERGNYYGSYGIAKDVDGDDKGAKKRIGRLEVR